MKVKERGASIMVLWCSRLCNSCCCAVDFVRLCHTSPQRKNEISFVYLLFTRGTILMGWVHFAVLSTVQRVEMNGTRHFYVWGV